MIIESWVKTINCMTEIFLNFQSVVLLNSNNKIYFLQRESRIQIKYLQTARNSCAKIFFKWDLFEKCEILAVSHSCGNSGKPLKMLDNTSQDRDRS